MEEGMGAHKCNAQAAPGLGRGLTCGVFIPACRSCVRSVSLEQLLVLWAEVRLGSLGGCCGSSQGEGQEPLASLANPHAHAFNSAVDLSP